MDPSRLEQWIPSFREGSRMYDSPLSYQVTQACMVFSFVPANPIVNRTLLKPSSKR